MNRLPTVSDLYTSSRDRCASRCLREHHLLYQLGYRSVRESEALRFGTLFHKALEAWWGHAQHVTMRSVLGQTLALEDRLTESLGALLANADQNVLDLHALFGARALMVGYHERWKDEPLETLAVEAEFTAPLVNPDTGFASKTWRMGGKIDAIARRGGSPYVVEHKTTTQDVSPGGTYWKKLRLDGQIGFYWAGAEALGHNVVGVIYDVISKPTLRPYKATPQESRKFTKAGALYAGQRERDETPEEYGVRVAEDIALHPDSYFSRCEIVRLESEMQEFRQDIWARSRMVHEANLAGRAPRNADACERYGGMCQFWPVCVGEATLEDTTLYRHLESVHPELNRVTETA